MNDRNQFLYESFFQQRSTVLKSLIALLAFAWTNLSIAQDLRTWTSSTGVQAPATFRDLLDGEVRLIDKSGKPGKFQLVKFSEPDQKYAKELKQYLNRKNRGEAVAPPVDPRRDATPIDPAAEKKKEKEDAFAGALGEEPEAKKPNNGEVPKEALMTFTKRTWKSVKGKSVEGRLHSASGDKVYILDTVNNRLLPAPVLSLSDKDRDYVMVQLRGLGRNDLLAALNLPKEEPPKPDAPAAQVAAAPAQVAPNPPVAAAPAQIPQNRFAGGPSFPTGPQFGNASQAHSQAQQRMAQMRAESQQRMAQMHADSQRRIQEMHQRHAQAFAPAPVAQVEQPQVESPFAKMHAETQQRMAEMQAESERRHKESMDRVLASQPPNMQSQRNRNPLRTSTSPGWGTPVGTPAAAPAGGTVVTTTKSSAYEAGAQVGRIVGIIFMVVVVVGFVAKLAQA